MPQDQNQEWVLQTLKQSTKQLCSLHEIKAKAAEGKVGRGFFLSR